jgi:hypothetical protein
LSALCKAVAPEQVHVAYSSSSPLPFRVEWCGEFGPVSFAGTTPDEAAERALHTLRARLILPALEARQGMTLGTGSQEPASSSRPSASHGSAAATEPLTQVSWAEAMRERIQQIEERGTVRRPSLRLVRS